MKPVEIVKECLSAIERSDFVTAGALIAEDFRMLGASPEPLGKMDWLYGHVSMNQAFPDFSFNLSEVGQREDEVHASVRVTGTHLGLLDFSSLGIARVMPTGKTIALPPQNVEFQVSRGKISSALVEDVPGGGFAGLLGQLGLSLPVSTGA